MLFTTWFIIQYINILKPYYLHNILYLIFNLSITFLFLTFYISLWEPLILYYCNFNMKFFIPFIYFIHFYYYYLGDVGAATPYSLGFLFQVEHTSQEFSLRFQLRIALEAKGKFVQVSGMGINRGYHLTNNGKRFLVNLLDASTLIDLLVTMSVKTSLMMILCAIQSNKLFYMA